MAAANLARHKTRTILLALTCFGFVVLLTAVFVYPKAQRFKAQQRHIAELEMALKEQKTLLPFYSDLVKLNRRETPELLSCPPLKKLSREATRELTHVFQSIAAQCDLRLATVVPIVDDTHTMQVDIAFQGAFLQFRTLLLKLGQLPYVKSIETFNVQSLESEREIQLRLIIEQG